ncbi:unnamed protein product [Fusarium graminearum]|nr:unnamed protein product [Fusarium graminearum]
MYETGTRLAQNNEPSLDSAGDSGGRKLLACISTVDNASPSDGDRIGVMDAVLDGGYSLIHWSVESGFSQDRALDGVGLALILTLRAECSSPWKSRHLSLRGLNKRCSLL